MKPRVFVSSTFYDLKYIREDLANFIRLHDFEPIMFEEGDIGYTPGKELDKSCYESVRNADMALLIIGGQYGSRATGQHDKKTEFISVTRREFASAANDNVPIFCFVESSVLAEHQIYKLNKKKIEKKQDAIKFSAVKNINVFKFIEEVYEIGKIPVNSFEKSDDIKEFMRKQWSDMFKKYLQALKDEQMNNSLNSTMSSMDLILKQMKVMVDKIGEKTITNATEFESIIDEQGKIEVEKVALNISQSMSLELSAEDLKDKKKNAEVLIKIIEKNINDNKYLTSTDFTKSTLKVRCNSLVTTFIHDNSVQKVIQNPKTKKYLIDLLQQDGYYHSIFTDDIHFLIPNWDEIMNYDYIEEL